MTLGWGKSRDFTWVQLPDGPQCIQERKTVCIGAALLMGSFTTGLQGRYKRRLPYVNLKELAHLPGMRMAKRPDAALPPEDFTPEDFTRMEAEARTALSVTAARRAVKDDGTRSVSARARQEQKNAWARAKRAKAGAKPRRANTAAKVVKPVPVLQTPEERRAKRAARMRALRLRKASHRGCK